MKNRKRFWSLFFGLAVLAVLIVGWSVFRQNGGDRRPKPGATLRIFFTGETLGELEPCNCGGKMAGGLPVRGGYLAQQTGPRLLLDVGCVGNGAREFELLRMDATLRAMKVMGYDAVNVGEHELWLGATELCRRLAAGTPFVSANVLGPDGVAPANPYVLSRRGGPTAAITGLADHRRYAPGPGLRLDPPREALGRLLPELTQKAGVIVVLADLDLPVVRELAAEFPEITAIFFRGRGDSHPPEIVNRTAIASVYGEARYIAEVTLIWATEKKFSAQGQAVLLDERFSPDAAVVRTCPDWYKAALEGRAFDLSEAKPGWPRISFERPEADNKYVGSSSCRKCHEQAYAAWEKSRHAQAMDSLRKVGYARSPECIVCHTVGYGASDGWRSSSETPELDNVGCESCHGRGHILRDGGCRMLAKPTSEDTCRSCHDAKHHPTFSLGEDWPKIEHKENR